MEYAAEPIEFSTLHCRGTVELNQEGRFDDGSGERPYSQNCDCKWLITWGNQVLVWFVTDRETQGRGWRAEYSLVDAE